MAGSREMLGWAVPPPPRQPPNGCCAQAGRGERTLLQLLSPPVSAHPHSNLQPVLCLRKWMCGQEIWSTAGSYTLAAWMKMVPESPDPSLGWVNTEHCSMNELSPSSSLLTPSHSCSSRSCHKLTELISHPGTPEVLLGMANKLPVGYTDGVFPHKFVMLLFNPFLPIISLGAPWHALWSLKSDLCLDHFSKSIW